MQPSTKAMGGLADSLAVEGIAQVTKYFTGERPPITTTDEYSSIGFTENQKKVLQKQLKAWHDKEPGKIRVDVQSVLLPFYLKRYAPYIAGIGIAGVVTGFVVAKLVSK